MFHFEAACYLDLGWCVYPAHTVVNGLCTCGKLDCPCPGKHPIGSWSDYRHRLPTKREIDLWFGSMDCNVGVITGQVSGGLVVVDVDGKQGLESLERLNLKRTLEANTGGGGKHLLYWSTEPIPSRVHVLPGIDIRGEGGYVVLPPSNHISGKCYEWEEKPHKMAIFDPTIFDAAISDYSINHGNHTNSNGKAWFKELLNGVDEGARNVSAARLAGRYFGMGLSMGEVMAIMRVWNSRNRPPLPDFELTRTVDAIRVKHETETLPSQVQTLRDVSRLLKGSA